LNAAGTADSTAEPAPDPGSLQGVAVDGVLYEMAVFVADYSVACD
jgi:hypothetical protein